LGQLSCDQVSPPYARGPYKFYQQKEGNKRGKGKACRFGKSSFVVNNNVAKVIVRIYFQQKEGHTYALRIVDIWN
jgi:hypothetical protein